MESKEYYIGFYSIFAGVAGTGLVVNWVKILKDYPARKVTWYQLLWSFQFFMLLAWEWYRPLISEIQSPGALMQILISPIVLYAICYLFLPQSDEEYNHPLENQKIKIALLGIIWCLNKYFDFYLAHNRQLFGTAQIQLLVSLTVFTILTFDRSTYTWAAGSIAEFIYSVIIFSSPVIGTDNSFFGSVLFMSCVLVVYFLRKLRNKVPIRI